MVLLFNFCFTRLVSRALSCIYTYDGQTEKKKMSLMQWKWSQPIPKQAFVFIGLQYKSFENTVGKGEIAHNVQFLLFPQCFSSPEHEASYCDSLLCVVNFLACVRCRGHIFRTIIMKHGQNVCLDGILDEFENGSCWIKN